MKKIILLCFILIFGVLLYACKPAETEPTDELRPDPSLSISEKVEWWIDHLTIEEKAGQMIQAERTTNNGISGATLYETTSYKLGSILNGGGNVPSVNSVAGWLQMATNYRQASMNTSSGIPIIYGVDAVHGHNNLLNATIFPHNIGLAAANNPDLMRQIGEITAYEAAQTGMHMNFSPSIGLIKDKRWGRVYETLGENPDVAKNLIGPYIEGIQSYGMIGSAKHFIGDGYTLFGTGLDGKLDRGNAEITEDELINIHLPLYQEAIDHGVKSIMISYSSLNGVRMHQNKHLITDILKGEMGFDGFVISDYQATNDVTGSNFEQKIITTVNAGIDMLMEPHAFDQAYEAIISGYQKGLIEMDRIDDAVRRILTVKYEMGLFDEITPPESDIRSEENLAIARQAVRESLVLLKNDQALPLDKAQNLLVIGPGSNDIGIQSGGWTISWQGQAGDITEGTTILEAFQSMSEGTIYTSLDDIDKVDAVVVVLAERPVAEMMGDLSDLSLNGSTGYQENVDLLEALADVDLPVIGILISGKPLMMTDYMETLDGFIMAFLPGTEGLGITDVIYGDYNFKGHLPYTYPSILSQVTHTMLDEAYNPDDYLFPYGHGLSYQEE
ncbi:MAG: glycoside hydrolase family 3 protein [Acholeplasmataceae bacterium]|jgi:beta-glucosidase|nr:glycoside hydrolase family 3 protein [Acholeplasmataceae bacterium]